MSCKSAQGQHGGLKDSNRTVNPFSASQDNFYSLQSVSAHSISLFYTSIMSLLAKPSALLQQLETALNQPRLARFKNVVFVLVLLHYWSRLYSKVIVRGPTRAAKDAYAYCLKVCLSRIVTHPLHSFD